MTEVGPAESNHTRPCGGWKADTTLNRGILFQAPPGLAGSREPKSAAGTVSIQVGDASDGSHRSRYLDDEQAAMYIDIEQKQVNVRIG
jgi:hypothetical protein